MLFTCVLVSSNLPLCTCVIALSRPGVHVTCFDLVNPSTFDHMDLPSSLNSAFCNARSAVGEPAQGVGSGGLFTVVLLYEFVVT